MITHIVIWNYKDELSAEARKKACKEMKDALESLPGKIDGLQSLVLGENFTQGGGDLCLLSQLDSKKALSDYQVHPEHVAAASIVKSYVKDRVVSDFES